MSIAVLWFFVIAVLKIVGSKKVGFFAGRLIRPTSSDHAEAGVEVVMENDPGPIHYTSHDDHVQKSFDRRVIFVRMIFVACAILTIIASILFYTKGVAAFKNSIDSMTRGIDVSKLLFHDYSLIRCIDLSPFSWFKIWRTEQSMLQKMS